MKTILVVANETLGGAPLLELIREKAGDGKARVVVCVPRTKPKHGNVIYDDSVYDAARVRVDLARAVLRDEGIEAIGDVGDPDPFSATLDALHEHSADEIVISTLPATSSGWQRRDLVERVREAVGPINVEHIETDLDADGLPFGVTLVVAAKTASSDELLEALKSRAEGAERHLFIVTVPQEGGEGVHASRARARLVQLIDRARAQGLYAAGTIGDPDPYTAAMNALQFFRIDDIVVSTLPATRSGWLRTDLIDRLRNAAHKPVEHIEAKARESAAA